MEITSNCGQPPQSTAENAPGEGLEYGLSPFPSGYRAGCSIFLCALPQIAKILARPDGNHQVAATLTSAEYASFLSFRLPKRQREWWGGRLAAKHCVRELFPRDNPPRWREIAVLPDALGRPWLAWSAAERRPGGILLSISHSGDLAGAMARNGGPCGIDLQYISPKVLRVRERFADAAEENELREKTNWSAEQQLTLLWAAKEAVKKCLLSNRADFFQAIRLHAVHRQTDSRLLLHCCCLEKTVAVHAAVLDSAIIAWTIGEEETPYAGTP